MNIGRRRAKPIVWSSRSARGRVWWITWPDGDVTFHGRNWRAAIAALDIWIGKHWPKQRTLLRG